MSASPELNMEALFNSSGDNEAFDDLQVDAFSDEKGIFDDTEADEDRYEENEAAAKEEKNNRDNQIPEILISVAAGPHASSDQELLFRELMRDHQKRLYRFVIRYINHPDDAADITQQAFAEASRTISNFRGDSKLSTWLYGIAMNMVRNYMRKLIEQDLYELPVVSYQELTPEVNIQPLARVEI